MEFDALTAGIQPGGLVNRTEIRILICYILKSITGPIPAEPLKELLHFGGIANYFEVSYAIAELEKAGHVQAEQALGTQCYRICESGVEIAQTLETALPLTVREKACALTLKMLTRKQHEMENKVDLEDCAQGCYVTCTVLEAGTPQMSLRLLVPDRMSAQVVRNAFLNDPTSLYGKVIETLTQDAADAFAEE